MDALSDFVTDAIEATLAPAVLTTAAAALAGHFELGHPAAPVNAISHVPFGDKAAWEDEPSIKYTLTGAAVNVAAIASWAAIYEASFGRAARRGNTLAGVVGGPVIAALAYVTDYYVVPDRLTPGFEKRISGRSMFGIYAALAASLPIASLLCRRR